MTPIFQGVLRFLSRKLLIRNREAVHPYFGRMTYYDHGDSSKAYWEAGLSHPQLPNEISVTFRGSPNGPEVAEETFCREVMSDLDALFSKCSDAFRAEFPAWTEEAFPADWRGAFELNGFSVPADGAVDREWHVCYFVPPTSHYFTAEFEGGRVARVVVDG